MNTMQRLNKLIGQTMAALRKARGRKRELLSKALGWLNKARAYVKRAYQMSADFAMRQALACLEGARQWA